MFFFTIKILTYCVGGRTTNVNTCTCMCKHDTMYPGGVCAQMCVFAHIWGVCICAHIHIYIHVNTCMYAYTRYLWDKSGTNQGQTSGVSPDTSGGGPQT